MDTVLEISIDRLAEIQLTDPGFLYGNTYWDECILETTTTNQPLFFYWNGGMV